MNKFYTYILQSNVDNSFYIGSTSDLKNRLYYHNRGSSPYTSKKIPWKIVYFESFNNKTVAIKREKFLKNQKNKNFYYTLIMNFKGSRSSAG